MDTLEALEAYGIATAGGLTALRAGVLAAGRETGVRGASDAAGAGLALSLLCSSRGWATPPNAGPRALLERHGVALAEARAGGGGGLREALVELADTAETRIDEAESRLAALPAALAPAFAPLAMARLDLKRLRRAPAARFAPAAPWRRQWALWLWARRR